jgi:hypothetical protein
MASGPIRRHTSRSRGEPLNSSAVASSTSPATSSGWRRHTSMATGPPTE